MKILLLNHYAGVGEMEHRPYYLAREWTRRGHEVAIVAASFSHLRERNPIVARPLSKQRVADIDYVWLKTPRYEGNGVARALNIMAFVAQLLRFSGDLARTYRPDIVIASSTHPLDIYPAFRIARRTAGTLLFEVHDLWPLTLVELGGMSRLHPFIALMGMAESFAYRNARRVISILPNAESYMRGRGMAAGKFIYVPNGIDTAEWSSAGPELPEEHANVLRRLKAEGKFIIGYAGAHGIANALPIVLRAAEQLQSEPVNFVLVGRGPEKPRLQAEVISRRITNVTFLPPVPKSRIPALLREMDALYIGLKNEALFRFGVCPNKLIDYMMAGRPVIQAINASNDLVTEAACGYSVPSENPFALAHAVVDLMGLSPDRRREMGLRGTAYVRTRHSYEVLAERFLASVSDDARTGSRA